MIARPFPSSSASRPPSRPGADLRPVGEPPVASRLGFLLRMGSLEVRLPDGSRRLLRGSSPGPAAEIAVHRPGLAGRLLRRGAIGLPEAYMDGDFDSPDLPTFLELMTSNVEAWLGTPAGRLREPAARAWDRVRRPAAGAVRSMREHYDLGNEFYALWLDDSMTYSSAVFADSDETLEAAQARKHRLLAEDAQLRPGNHVLETGTGWGSFAVYAAREHGCRVTTITIAREQAEFARRAAQQAGVADRVEVLLQDYREITGTFDRAVSVEMIESIDERRWPGYLRTVARALRPGGRFALQSITMAERHWPNHRRHDDFVMAYIFPGGRVPAVSVLRRLTARAGFRWESDREIGSSYALTLAEWNRRFAAAADQVQALGFDRRFRRMWTYYLSYCEAGFRTGWVGDKQVALVRT
ncbi:MAG: class I SAM-dependent methyltransferase [Actinomycetota bacterium]